MLLKKIKEDIKNAMKEKDIETRDILRVIVAKANDIAKSDNNRDVNSEDIKMAIQKQVKQNKETISFLQEDNRSTEKEDREINILMAYLPKQMSKEETTELVKKIVMSIPEKERTNKSRGLIMKELSKYKDVLDMKEAGKIVGSFLNK